MNIILDLGNVVVSFQPDYVLASLFEDTKVQDTIKELYFGPLWHAYDHGRYTVKEMIDLGKEKFPMYAKEMEVFMRHWTQYIEPIESSVALIQSLKKDGHKVYLLSNLPEDCFIHIRDELGIMDLVDGGVYSYQERCIKPDFKIYETLLKKYDIMANDCLFVDDRIENIRAAQALGLDTIHCTNPSVLPIQIEEKLR